MAEPPMRRSRKRLTGDALRWVGEDAVQCGRRDGEASVAILAFHVEDDFLVHQQFVVQAQVVAVWIQLILIERLNPDVATKSSLDFTAAQNHEAPAGSNRSESAISSEVEID